MKCNGSTQLFETSVGLRGTDPADIVSVETLRGLARQQATGCCTKARTLPNPARPHWLVVRQSSNRMRVLIRELSKSPGKGAMLRVPSCNRDIA